MKLNKTIVSLLVMLSLSAIQPSFASTSGVCDPGVGQTLATDYMNKASRDKTAIDELAELNKPAIESAQDSYSCSDIWEGANVSISFQKVQDLIKKAGQALVSKACSAARDKITEATSSVSQKVSLNTSNIPGLSDLGMGTIGSVSTGTGSTGYTVNGQSVSMANISNLLK